MASTADSITEKLRALHDNFAAQLPGRIRELEEVWDKLRDREGTAEEQAEPLRILHYLSHKLTGTGATFGFSAVSDASRTLETFVREVMEGCHRLTAEQRSRINDHVEDLKQAATMKDDAVLRQETIPSSRPPRDDGNKTIYLVEDDAHLAQDLALQIGYFNYTVRVFNNLAGFRDAVSQSPPTAVIMDINLPDGNGAAAITETQKECSHPLPTVFLSGRGDLAARLDAVRAGGVAYFTKPVDLAALVDALDRLTANRVREPYRVLIVEDTVSLANYYALTLRQAGMITEVVSEPLQVMMALTAFCPELILMDMYMPDCTGLELAKVIRQQETYVGIPIVFLSAETNLDKQLEAMRQGGDDFLVKPIQPDHLISAVASRTQRYRILRSFMSRDSLTGLCNHTTTKELLSNAYSLAKRRGAPLSFAMIDIDHFKAVNDTHGHAAGDRVIKSLARLLQQRLRKSDIIGRYGGEEFAVALIDADASQARRIMDEIRADFAQVRHGEGGREFTATFSCGIATIPSHSHPAALIEASDKALYDAKRGGRNKVVLASGCG
ncbi:MAG: diguanylate cyclase [Pseudomonadota bacterium]